MSVEIERKYLVKNDKWRDTVKESQHITQGYIKADNATVRIRCYKDEHKAEITVKGKRDGISRLEFEYEIPYPDAREMQDTLCDTPLVEKTRHLIKYKGMLWELYELPDWVGEDVSYDSRYRNSRLSVNPYKDWG